MLTADKFANDYAIRKSFRHALNLVTAHLHRQNQVAHELFEFVLRDFWLVYNTFPNTFRTARALESRNLNPTHRCNVDLEPETVWLRHGTGGSPCVRAPPSLAAEERMLWERSTYEGGVRWMHVLSWWEEFGRLVKGLT